MLYKMLKPFLFSQDSEGVHDRLLDLMKRYPELSRLGLMEMPSKTPFSSDLGWTSPIGLAAGFDKNAIALDFLEGLGFGAIEVGTVTPLPQKGNLKKRIHRDIKREALINWMGFPSEGAEVVLKRIKKYQGRASIGINIGKNLSTPNSKAIDDYKDLFYKFHDSCQYIVINISSPNTKGLRDLQNESFLNELCTELKKIAPLNRLLVKFAPENERVNLERSLRVLSDHHIWGVIGTNTTSDHEFGQGGLSGRPLYDKSYHFLKMTSEILKGSQLQIVGCGGISKREHIEELAKLGIEHFQIYSSFIYQGSGVIKRLAGQ